MCLWKGPSEGVAWGAGSLLGTGQWDGNTVSKIFTGFRKSCRRVTDSGLQGLFGPWG